ncbi:MAG: VWA domain-containing protein [Pyrinomonadaceae bacterium]
MKKSLILFFASISLFSISHSQTPSIPPPQEDASVVKISTDLIQVDVTVTDKNGKVITNLRREDFEIFENGERQSVTGFAFVGKTLAGASVAATAKQNGLKPGLPVPPPKPLTASAVRRTLAIVVDDVQLSFSSVSQTRKALRRFVDEQMLPDDLVAIIRTGGGVGALQQFTSDKRVLRAAIERLRWNPAYGAFDSLSPVSQNASDITERFRRESDNVASGSSKQTTTILPSEGAHDKKSADVSRNSAKQEAGMYVQSSLGAVKYILAGMQSLPGRKAMLFFSDGLDATDLSVKSSSSIALSFLQDVAELANRSSVVVYTFDARGMQSMAIGASDSTYEIIDGYRGVKQTARRDDFMRSQDGLVYFANRTGGRAFLNSDNFNYGIQRALDDQAGYYLLAYVPDAESFDPEKRKFNKLEIRVKRPGVDVSYRSGFFNVPGDLAAPNQSPDRKLVGALMSPFTENAISLNISALFANDKTDGPYIRSFLHIDARGLVFRDDADGWKKSTFDVVAAAFGDNGMPVETKESQYTIKTKGATYESMLERGFVYVLPLPLKKPGLYQFRVAVRDTETGKIGSAYQIVEVPDLTKKGFILSSLAVENVSLETWRNMTSGKIGNRPGQVQVPSTLLYDTVLRQFSPGSVLRYGYEVYDGSGQTHPLREVEARATIFRDNSAVVKGNLNKIDVSAQKDPRRLAISGAMTLPDSLEPGDYVLNLSVFDSAGNRSATQILPFEIVK